MNDNLESELDFQYVYLKKYDLGKDSELYS